MRGQPVTRGALRRVRVVEQREVDVARRVRHLLAQQQLADRAATQRRRAAARVRIQRREAHLGDQPGARVVGRELVRHEARIRPLHRNVVDAPERAADEGLAGREQVAVVALLRDHEVDDGAQRLLARIGGDRGAEGRVDQRILLEPREVLERQHVVEEHPHARLEPRRRHHPVDLRLEPVAIVQLAALGGREQRVVGRRAPEEEAEPLRLRVPIEPLLARRRRVRLGRLDHEQERRRHQHAGEARGEAVIEAAEARRRLARDRHRAAEFLGRQRVAEQQAACLREERLGAGLVGPVHPRRLAGHQHVTVLVTDHLGGDRARHAVELLQARRRHVRLRRADRQQAVRAHHRVERTADHDLRAEHVGDDLPVLRLGQQAHGRVAASRRRRRAATGSEPQHRQAGQQDGAEKARRHRWPRHRNLGDQRPAAASSESRATGFSRRRLLNRLPR